MGFVLVTRVGMQTRSGRVLAVLAQGFLRGVVASNRVTLRDARRRGAAIPPLYESGVEYDREPWGGVFEEFADITTVLERGWGDCDDLCAWRTAELLEQGEPASCRIYWRTKASGALMMHVQVRRGICHADGTLLKEITDRRMVTMPTGHTVRALTQCPHCQAFNTGKIEDPSRFLGL